MKKILITLLILTFLTSTALADTIEPLFGFKTITDFPTDIKAGQTYQSECSFASTHDTSILINFTVSHLDINYDEWSAYFILNGTDMSFNESAPGHFTSNITSISKGNHNLIISFHSLYNIVPGQYGYEFNLFSEQIEVTSVSTRSRSSGSRTSTWPITTPTATETSVSTPTSVSTVMPDVSMPTVTSTPALVNITAAQTYLTTDYRPHMILGSMIFLLAAIISLIILGRRKKARAAEILKKK